MNITKRIVENNLKDTIYIDDFIRMFNLITSQILSGLAKISYSKINESAYDIRRWKNDAIKSLEAYERHLQNVINRRKLLIKNNEISRTVTECGRARKGADNAFIEIFKERIISKSDEKKQILSDVLIRYRDTLSILLDEVYIVFKENKCEQYLNFEDFSKIDLEKYAKIAMGQLKSNNRKVENILRNIKVND